MSPAARHPSCHGWCHRQVPFEPCPPVSSPANASLLHQKDHYFPLNYSGHFPQLDKGPVKSGGCICHKLLCGRGEGNQRQQTRGRTSPWRDWVSHSRNMFSVVPWDLHLEHLTHKAGSAQWLIFQIIHWPEHPVSLSTFLLSTDFVHQARLCYMGHLKTLNHAKCGWQMTHKTKIKPTTSTGQKHQSI